jgi:16S rRNA (guanine527-N7)-methyltransferase
MDTPRIADLLQPFLPAPLSADQLASIATYIDLLLRWNARLNLTAVREEEYIVTRHFGESLFAACHLFPAGQTETAAHLFDVGSGAGFPGLPIKLWNPRWRMTLIDSNHKKATFLREVIRTLNLSDIEVFAGRTEDYPGHAEIVTLRAVEKFDQSLPAAANLLSSRSDGRLVRPSEARAQVGASHDSRSGNETRNGGKIALLIGEAQRKRAQELQPSLLWDAPQPIPLSNNRILLIGTRPSAANNRAPS